MVMSLAVECSAEYFGVRGGECWLEWVVWGWNSGCEWMDADEWTLYVDRLKRKWRQYGRQKTGEGEFVLPSHSQLKMLNFAGRVL